LQKARADGEKLRRKLIFHSLYKGAPAAHSGLHQMRSRRAFFARKRKNAAPFYTVRR